MNEEQFAKARVIDKEFQILNRLKKELTSNVNKIYFGKGGGYSADLVVDISKMIVYTPDDINAETQAALARYSLEYFNGIRKIVDLRLNQLNMEFQIL